jgi:hypothetical protein
VRHCTISKKCWPPAKNHRQRNSQRTSVNLQQKDRSRHPDLLIRSATVCINLWSETMQSSIDSSGPSISRWRIRIIIGFRTSTLTFWMQKILSLHSTYGLNRSSRKSRCGSSSSFSLKNRRSKPRKKRNIVSFCKCQLQPKRLAKIKLWSWPIDFIKSTTIRLRGWTKKRWKGWKTKHSSTAISLNLAQPAKKFSNWPLRSMSYRKTLSIDSSSIAIPNTRDRALTKITTEIYIVHSSPTSMNTLELLHPSTIKAKSFLEASTAILV